MDSKKYKFSRCQRFIPAAQNGYGCDIVVRTTQYVNAKAAALAVVRMKVRGWIIADIFPTKGHRVLAVKKL